MMTKMVMAIVRPEKESEVVSAIEKTGFFPLTRFPGIGCGRERRTQVKSGGYEAFPKVCLMISVEEGEVDRVLDAIRMATHAEDTDGEDIFVSNLNEMQKILYGS